jgi:hypothetical protein
MAARAGIATPDDGAQRPATGKTGQEIGLVLTAPAKIQR